MNECQRKKTRKIPTRKEQEACLARGYKMIDTYLGGGAMGRVFLAHPMSDAIEGNMKLQLFSEKYQSFQVFYLLSILTRHKKIQILKNFKTFIKKT